MYNFCIETLCKRAISVAHLTSFSFEFFNNIFTEDASQPFLYHGAKKSKLTKNWPKKKTKNSYQGGRGPGGRWSEVPFSTFILRVSKVLTTAHDYKGVVIFRIFPRAFKQTNKNLRLSDQRWLKYSQRGFCLKKIVSSVNQKTPNSNCLRFFFSCCSAI